MAVAAHVARRAEDRDCVDDVANDKEAEGDIEGDAIELPHLVHPKIVASDAESALSTREAPQTTRWGGGAG